MRWLGLSGWRWLLILEGLPALVGGVVALFYLTDRPRDAVWLNKDEREWIAGELDRENREVEKKHSRLTILQAFRNAFVLTLVPSILPSDESSSPLAACSYLVCQRSVWNAFRNGSLRDQSGLMSFIATIPHLCAIRPHY